MQRALFDTGFLIRLMNKEEALHKTVVECYKYCLSKKILPITSSICIAEYAPQANPDNIMPEIKVMPFTRATASIVGQIYARRDFGGSRDSIKDDYKIIATAMEQNCDFMITADADTFKKYADRSAQGKIKTIVISKDIPFSPQLFNDGIGDNVPLLEEKIDA